MESEKNISYKNICYKYNKTNILKDVSFDIKSGQCCALIGHNGAGKTTLIKLLLGVIKANSGVVKLCQKTHSAKNDKNIKSQIGFVPEIINFQPNYTGLELMKYIAKLKSVSLEEIAKKLKQTDIYYAKDKKISEYSKGMKQRLALSQAMLGNPKVLILDEPTSGLDPDSRMILYKTLKKHAQKGNTVMFSSHALNDIEQYIDKVILLNQGKVLISSNISDYKKSVKVPVVINFEVSAVSDVSEFFFDNLKSIGDLEINDIKLKLVIEHSKKMQAISLISNESTVTDINIENSNLEDIYHQLLKKETEE